MATRAALRRAVASATARTTRLQAVYVDTTDQRLAAAGLALRLRKEGRVWVQTLKGRGDGLMQRLEHEVTLPTQVAAIPTLNRHLHAGTAAGDALDAALKPDAELLPVYRTDIRRLHRRVRHQGAVIEIAYDCGHIMAGDQKLAVDEIEFELISGPAQALPALAARWSQRFGLWWDVRTKSERGFRLALGLAQVPPVKAQVLNYSASSSPQAAFQNMLQSALLHVLPNAAELAGGGGTAEHLHQLRVALRRLRTALAVFATWAVDEAQAGDKQAPLRTLFNALGAARDADVVAHNWLPQMVEAGAPTALPATTEAAQADVGPLLRDATFSVLLLQTLVLAMPSVAPEADPADLRSAAARVLKTLWRRARSDAKAFAQAPAEQRHRARKRLKRLRYALEFLAPVFDSKKTQRFQQHLNAALEAMGHCNDLQVAQAHFENRAETLPQAWFAVGWLAAQRGHLLRIAKRRLAKLRTCSLHLPG